METIHRLIPTEKIAFDRENPRIKVALQKYGDDLNDQRIRFALQNATEGSSSVSSYRALKDSIRAAGGISNPIRVYREKDQYVCVDGNTRLAIYKDLHGEMASGGWTKIQCLELIKPSQPDIETIRVTAHLVGAREWPAYEKARYLHHLRNEQFLGYDQLIELCGGNKTTITRQIDAFHDMNKHYRDVNNDDAFRVDRFSGFVELQKPSIKESIFSAGFDLSDFGQWIRDGQIFRLADVRKLPVVLNDDQAKEAFVNGGPRSIEEGIRIAEENRLSANRPTTKETTLAEADMATLAEVLLNQIKNLPFQDIVNLRDRKYESAQQEVDVLTDLAENLGELLRNVSE